MSTESYLRDAVFLLAHLTIFFLGELLAWFWALADSVPIPALIGARIASVYGLAVFVMVGAAHALRAYRRLRLEWRWTFRKARRRQDP